MTQNSNLLSGKKINPCPLDVNTTINELIDQVFLSYNAGRLRETCHVFTKKMMQKDVTIGMSIAGALTPAGLGASCLVPLMKKGCIDWIVSTGANLYHDIHFALDLPLRMGRHDCDDRLLREQGVVRIYDIFFNYTVLLETDLFLRNLFRDKIFQQEMGTAELHYRIGERLSEIASKRGTADSSILVTAYQLDIPVYTSAPGDSSIGMNVAAGSLAGALLKIDVARDINETAAIVFNAKLGGGGSGVLIIGGGSPKNFLLQTEPYIQEVLGLNDTGHDYFIQFTDARPDSGGLSGATPSEAISWGKVDPGGLPNTVVAYLDSTVALPLLTAYVLQKGVRRKQKRLYQRRKQLLDDLAREHQKVQSKTSALQCGKTARK